MDQRIAVQHLDRRRKLLGCFSAAVEHIAHGQNQHCADAFAAAQQAVTCSPADLRFHGQKSLAGLFQCLICPGKILLILLRVIHETSSLMCGIRPGGPLRVDLIQL